MSDKYAHLFHPANPRRQPPRPRGISINTFNIRDGRGLGLVHPTWKVQDGGFNLMVLTDTKVTNQAYSYNRLPYNMVCLPETKADDGLAQGGARLVARNRPKGRSVKSTWFHGPNVVSCKIFGDSKGTPLIGTYLPPSTLENLLDLEEAMTWFEYQDPIVLWDLNADTVQAQNPRIQQVTNMLMKFGLVDLLHQFRQLCWFLHMKKWLNVWKFRLLSEICDYILWKDRRRFKMVGISDVRNYSLYDFALQAILLQCPMRYHGSYLWGRRTLPLSLPTPEDFRPAVRKFQELMSLQPTLPPLTRLPHPQWMPEPSMRLIDKPASLLHNPRHNSNVTRKLTKYVRSSLLVDSRQQPEKATLYIGACLGPTIRSPDFRGAHAILKRRYCHASARAPNLSQEDMAKVTRDYAELYWRGKPTPRGRSLTTHVKLFEVNDNFPLEGEVEVMVQQLQLHKSGGYTHLHAEHFKKWL